MFRFLPRRLLTEPNAALQEVDTGNTYSTATIHVNGLVCSACAANVRSGLERTDGVQSAQVDLDSSKARVMYDPTRVRPNDLLRAVERKVMLPKLRRLLASFPYTST